MARTKKRLKIIIMGHRDSLSYLIVSWFLLSRTQLILSSLVISLEVNCGKWTIFICQLILTPTNTSKVSPQVVKIDVSLPCCINQPYLADFVFEFLNVPLPLLHVITTIISERLPCHLAIYEQLHSNLPQVTAAAQQKGHLWPIDAKFWRG